MKQTGGILSGIIASDEELQALVRKLSISPLVDEHGRGLKVTIERVVKMPETKTIIKFRAMANDLAKQVCLVHGKEFSHVADAGLQQRTFLSAEEWRGFLSACAMCADAIPHPDSIGLVFLMKSSKELTEKQAQEAISLAESIGNPLQVTWSEQQQQSPKE